ncbi:MAG TPA: hypothetical protein VFN90_11240 [Gemmatimonadales bacterium]|nr:hypothetical protein [Gemmatimonadales bacterium]
MTRTLGLAAALLVGACGANVAQESPEAFRTLLATTIATGDTTRLADLVADRCDLETADAKRDCLEATFLAIADSGRVRLALGTLAALGAGDRSVEAHGHSLTHVIGIRAWRPGDDVAAVFKSCNVLYQSGCYHGVVQAYLTAEAVDSLRVVELCERISPDGTDHWLRFQCVHGLGHGLEMAWNWDLPKALRGCDWLPGSWDRESCYGGAFMENAVASMPGGHHTSVTALAATTTDDHGHQHGPGTPTFPMRDPANPLHPCTAVDSTYHPACYLSQGGIILGAVEYDFAKAAVACDGAPTAVRDDCYTSLGTNASGMSVRNATKAIALCNEGHPDWRQHCHSGVVKNFIDVSADPKDGVRYCQKLAGTPSEAMCWESVGEELILLYTNDIPRREAVCRGIGGAGEAGCRRGARLDG